MTFHVVCRHCDDLEEVFQDGGKAHDAAREHLEEHPEHTAGFRKVA